MFRDPEGAIQVIRRTGKIRISQDVDHYLESRHRQSPRNSGQKVEDHFVGADQMIEIGKGGQRSVKTVMMSRYACYLVIQNADPAKEIVAQGQTYFAIQTRRQELSDEE
ncbi:MAG: hypothetical protein ABI162_11265, partial [Luteolibacter sp.]